MKTYYGKRDGSGYAVVLVCEVNDGTSYERQLRHVVRHSPTGFEWGYAGSGPADLAYSLLVDHFGGDAIAARKAELVYQPFKHRVVARLPRVGWQIDTAYIDEMLGVIEAAMRACDVEPHAAGAVVDFTGAGAQA